MITNKGVEKEAILVESLNNKIFSKLEHNLKLMIKFMFPNVKENDVIHSELMGDFIKPDILISISGRERTLSIKSGISNIIHQENIISFCEYLKSKGISDYTIKTILYFHYGDGTFDGSGVERMSYAMLRSKLEKAFKYANKELNKNREFVVECVKRFLIQGKDENNPCADYIYHGELENGVIVHNDQVLRYCEVSRCDFIESLHIGPILFRPHARYFNKTVVNARRRERIEFYWPNIVPDFIYIREHYYNRDK